MMCIDVPPHSVFSGPWWIPTTGDILVTDLTSSAGGLENVTYNAGRVSELAFTMTRLLVSQNYGFLTDSAVRVNSTVSTK